MNRYPGAAPGIFRMSVSDLEAYLTCGQYFLFRLEERHRRATVAMAIGTAVAHAAFVDNATKRDGGRLALPELVDHGVARYEKETEAAEIPQSRVEIARGKDDCRDATLCYGTDISPAIRKPLMAEEPLIAIVDRGIELAGTPDLIESDVVRDTKTGRAWDQRRTDRSRQLTAYSLLYEARLGKPPRRVAIDTISRTRSGWAGETVWSRRTERDYEAFLESMRRARRGIEAGIFLPAPELSWRCAPPSRNGGCPYWGPCKVRPGA